MIARAPVNLSALQRRISDYARKHGFSHERIHQRVSSEIFISLLTKAKADGVIPMYVLKGGMAMELRFGTRARASGDVDIGIHVPLEQLVSVLDDVLKLGFDAFTFRRKGEPEFLEKVQAYRLEIGISYLGKPFSNLRVDLNEANYEPPIETHTINILPELGLPGPTTVPLLDLYTQLAHKIHGGTEPSTPLYQNKRYRDVLDVLICDTNGTPLDYSRVRRVALEEFGRRSKHRWPPLFRMPAEWAEPIVAEAQRLGMNPSSAADIEREFIAFLIKAEGYSVREHYEYKFLTFTVGINSPTMMTDEGQRALDEHIAAGWRAMSIGSRPGYVDQMLAILERPPLVDTLPRLQCRLEAETIPGQGLVLKGDILNTSQFAANRVRVAMTGVTPVMSLGTLTYRDPGVPITIYYENEAARTQFIQFPAIIVQYATDDGRRVEQIGRLRGHSDASERWAYTMLGLEAPRLIEKFTHRHDALDDD